jgi:hypothetical protein
MRPLKEHFIAVRKLKIEIENTRIQSSAIILEDS